MNIVMMTGSPHARGTTDYLATRYAEGAVAAGHPVTRFDTARMDIRPCLACDHCRRNDSVCVQKDDMETILQALLTADRLALVTPLYYYGMTAQLKTAIDRFYARNDALRRRHVRIDLLAACSDEAPMMDVLHAHVRTVGEYMNWPLAQTLLAYECSTRADAEATTYGDQAAAMAGA